VARLTRNQAIERRRARPLYDVFLERVINIPAVRRHRAAALGDYDPTPPQLPGIEDSVLTKFFEGQYRAKFFSEGSNGNGDFRFYASKAESFPWGWQDKVKNFGWHWRDEQTGSLPIQPMRHALEAAAAAFEEFIKALKNGKLIASGVHPATGARYDLDPAEWTRKGLILEVQNGDLIQIEESDRTSLSIKKTVRWTAMTLRVGEEIKSSSRRGDRDGTPTETRHFNPRLAKKYTANYIENEHKAGRSPTQEGLEQAARDEGFVVNRKLLRPAWRDYWKNLGSEVKQGAEKIPPNRSAKK
jgi:hypothetical protein